MPYTLSSVSGASQAPLPSAFLNQRHDQQGDDVDDLDQRVHRRACGVFVRIANGVAGEEGFLSELEKWLTGT